MKLQEGNVFTIHRGGLGGSAMMSLPVIDSTLPARRMAENGTPLVEASTPPLQDGRGRSASPMMTSPYGKQTGGMHPTGMLSCCIYF